MPHSSASLLALLFAATGPEPEAVPIQRPSELVQPPADAEPTPAPRTDAPEPAPVARETVAPEPSSTTPPQPPTETIETTEPVVATGGMLEGVITDTEYASVTMAGVRVELHCTCLPEPVVTSTDVDGRFRVDDLPAGIYTVFGDRGGPATERVVALAPGEAARLDFQVGPPTTTVELDRRREESARAQTLLSVGGVSAVGGLLLLIGAAVENAKRDCLFEQEECAAAPRPSVTRGLAVSGAILTAGGAALIGLGVHKQRRLRASIAADDRSAALVISGRF